jgi:hypothetical protein
MIRHFLPFAFIGFAACGGGSDGDDAPPVDTPPAAQMVTISGTAQTVSAGGTDPAPGVLIEAFRNSADTTVVTSATTDAQGNYTLTVETNGTALDGFLKATKTGLLDTYLYPDKPLGEDFDGASINMVSQDTFDILAGGVFCDAAPDPAKGVIAALVFDAAQEPVAGATIDASPEPTSICYNGANGFPDNDATETAADGIGYMFNVTGEVIVSAMGTAAYPTHKVTARAGALTTTLFRP